MTSSASLSGSIVDSDHSFSEDLDEEFKNEYIRPVTVTVSDGSAFKTVIGDEAMTPGSRYFFEVQINAGYLIKIGICRKSVDSEQVSVLLALLAPDQLSMFQQQMTSSEQLYWILDLFHF